MIVEFKFNYLSDNGVLLYFLDFYAKNSGLKYSIHQNANEISLFIDEENEDKILKFGDESMNLIPNSIFLADSEVKVCSDFLQTNVQILNPNLPNLTPKMLKAKEITRNEFGILSGISVKKDGKFVQISDENWEEMSEFAFLQLLHNQTLEICDDIGEVKILPYIDFKSDFILPSNLLAISKMFAPDEKSLIALASFEKPILNLKLNAIFRKNHVEAPAFFDVKITKDLFLFKVFERLYLNGVFFLSAKTSQKRFKIAILENKFLVVSPSNLASKKKQNLEKTNVFSEICTEFGVENNVNIHINLDINEPDFIMLHKDTKRFSLLKFIIPATFDEIYDEIKSDETGAKLLCNFEKSFKFPNGKIPVQICEKPNFYGIFEIIARIIFNSSAQNLVENAKLFLGKKGAKVDFCVKQGVDFNLIALIKSAMAYRLAGSDEKLLSYGIIESLAYFLSDHFDNIEQDLGYENIIATGSLFGESIFTNTCVKLISKIKFSDQIGLCVC